MRLTSGSKMSATSSSMDHAAPCGFLRKTLTLCFSMPPPEKDLESLERVRVDDGRLVTSLEEKFNAMTFHSFLKKILRHRRHDRKILFILDNARWHHARILRPWLVKHSEAIQLDFLPPYSPELNAIERVWKLTRKLCCHNRYFPTFEELIETVVDKFESWGKLNETLRRLCAIT